MNLPAVRAASTVVVVEDDDDARTMLATLLRARGFEVTEAHDGPTGLAAILEHEPRFALIDIGLPRMSGLEVGRRVRAQFERHEICLAALTGFGQSSDRQAVRDAGFDHHFVKPLDPQRLEAALRFPPEEALRWAPKR